MVRPRDSFFKTLASLPILIDIRTLFELKAPAWMGMLRHGSSEACSKDIPMGPCQTWILILIPVMYPPMLPLWPVALQSMAHLHVAVLWHRYQARQTPTESDASACEVFWWHPFNSAPGPSIGQCLELPRLQVSSLNTRALLWGKALNICAFSLLTSRMSSVL